MNAAAERALDVGLAQWVRDRTGSEVLARAAQAASAAEGDGHACARLVELDDAEIATLRAHAWVGDGSAFKPFVLDRERRFWLWRNWRHEQRLADTVLERCAARTRPLDDAALAGDVGMLFAGSDAASTADQRAAVAAVPGTRLFVLTGGPGTGKTTVVVRMLLMLLRHAAACGLPGQPSIALAAPTGKAAQRLAQAIARGKDDLAPGLAGTAFDGLLEAIPHEQAQTLHRLLGYQPTRNRFGHDAEHRLPAHIVVVDEASMVDLATMRQLAEALPASSLLILLGDPDQLASVDAGSVLADIVAGAAAVASPLYGHVAALRHVWRAGGDLQRAIQALRDGEAGWTERSRDAAVGASLRACADAAAMHACIDGWLDRHAPAHARLFSTPIEPAAAFAVLRESQVLCALREGRFGAAGVNARIAERLGVRHGFDATQAWYHGRPVIVTRNDYAHGLFNGDVGIALAGEDGLRVWFEAAGRDGGALRSFSPRVLPACETAWAITIHRSQGSEYDEVAVVLPPDPEHRLLSRELVYTAISRARRRAELWTTAAALQAAVARRVERHGGLRTRLGGAPQPTPSAAQPRQGSLF